MILKWKGRCDEFSILPKGNLPPGAIMFKEPTTAMELNARASLYVIPVILIVSLAIVIRYMTMGVLGSLFDLYGFLLAGLMIIPHELLHAIAFPKGAEVDIWYSRKYWLAFVHSTAPVTKRRFIAMSLLPNVVFGLLPLIIWVVLPLEAEAVSGLLFSFAFLGLLFGIGDYMNVHNAIVQMPDDAMTQLSGFNSYWYKP